MNSPDVTVLMPARNAEKYIADAILSVINQTYTNFELLVVNDGSTDNTASVIKSFADSRIKLIEQEALGISPALNKRVEEARGKYIARFDADDICLPKRLEKQAGFLDKNPDYVLLGSDAEYIDENGGHLFSFRCIGHSH